MAAVVAVREPLEAFIFLIPVTLGTASHTPRNSVWNMVLQSSKRTKCFRYQVVGMLDLDLAAAWLTWGKDSNPRKRSSSRLCVLSPACFNLRCRTENRVIQLLTFFVFYRSVTVIFSYLSNVCDSHSLFVVLGLYEVFPALLLMWTPTFHHSKSESTCSSQQIWTNSWIWLFASSPRKRKKIPLM